MKYTLTLGKGDFLRTAEKLTEITCYQGILWITSANNQEDILLTPGKRYVLSNKKKICIQALESSKLELITQGAQILTTAFATI